MSIRDDVLDKKEKTEFKVNVDVVGTTEVDVTVTVEVARTDALDDVVSVAEELPLVEIDPELEKLVDSEVVLLNTEEAEENEEEMVVSTALDESCVDETVLPVLPILLKDCEDCELDTLPVVWLEDEDTVDEKIDVNVLVEQKMPSGPQSVDVPTEEDTTIDEDDEKMEEKVEIEDGGGCVVETTLDEDTEDCDTEVGGSDDGGTTVVDVEDKTTVVVEHEGNKIPSH